MTTPGFLRWIFPLLIAIAILIISAEAIEQMGDDNFWYHFTGACAIASGFYWYWVVRIKGPDSGIAFLDLWFDQSDLRKPKVVMSQFVKPGAVVIFRSKSKGLWGAIGWLGMGLLLFYYLAYKKESYFWAVFMGGFAMTAAVSFYKGLLDPSAQLILRDDGLATPTLGLVPWDSVVRIQLRDTSSSESDSMNLDIYLSHGSKPDDSLRADLLDIESAKLQSVISQFAGREVEIG